MHDWKSAKEPLTRLSKWRQVAFAYAAAKSVIHLFKVRRPDDTRLREALSACRYWLLTVSTDDAAADAADAAAAAADAAAADAAAAYAAAAYAADAAAYAAAADAAADAADAAAAAADAAAADAAAAYAAAAYAAAADAAVAAAAAADAAAYAAYAAYATAAAAAAYAAAAAADAAAAAADAAAAAAAADAYAAYAAAAAVDAAAADAANKWHWLTELLEAVSGGVPLPRSSDAEAIALTMRDSDDCTDMPILADALEDAGFDHAQTLDRLRNRPDLWFFGDWVIQTLCNVSR